MTDTAPPEDLLSRAEEGDAGAQCDMGLWYAQHPAFPGSRDLARQWFGRAGAQRSGRGLHNLAVMAFQDGDRVEAERLLGEASATGWALATFALATMRREAGDLDGAAALYEVAADQGHPEAEAMIGWQAMQAGTEEGYRTARALLDKAAAKGSAAAQVHLATMFHEGLGMDRDPALAAFWWSQAAKRGHSGAQAALAVAFHNGAGVTKNIVEAAFWAVLSANQGNAMARTYWPRIERDLTEADRTALAARLQPPAEGSRAN